MKRDSRLSGVLHLLLHLAEREEPTTSETLAKALRTNPVVIRRLLAGLRARGLVRADKGPGGGWTLACDPARVSLGEIHAALGAPALLASGHRTETPGCRVEQAVNAVLGGAFAEAEALLWARLAAVTLAQVGGALRGGRDRRPGCVLEPGHGG